MKRAAQWSLLLAAILQFGIAAVGPYWHYLAPRAEVLESREGEGPEAPAPLHSEQACVLCHSGAGVGPLPAGPTIPFAAISGYHDAAEPVRALAGVARIVPRARAPPLA